VWVVGVVGVCVAVGVVVACGVGCMVVVVRSFWGLGGSISIFYLFWMWLGVGYCCFCKWEVSAQDR
jgi:hypothetical protein